MKRAGCAAIAVSFFMVAVACGSDGGGGGLPYEGFYQQIQANMTSFSGTEMEDGNWYLDFGDAAYYGPAFFVGAGLKYGRDDYLDIGFAGIGHDNAVVEKALSDLGYFMSDLEEVLMAAFALVETMSMTGDTEGIEKLDQLIDLVNQTAESLGTYIDVDIPSYALHTYGNTVVTASVALLNLRYAELLDNARSKDRLEFGLKVIDAADAKAWSGSVYRFKPGEDKLFLYPNVTMILCNATAFKLTGEARYRERCEATHAGIQPLKDPVKHNYHSPYSAVLMGAKTDEYSTLSVHDFTMMALALMFEITVDGKYRDEFADIEGFIEGYLYRADHILVDVDTDIDGTKRDFEYAGGGILHHWMDGRVAVPTDPEYFCSGCNLQFLFVSLYAEDRVFGKGAPGAVK